MSTTRVPPHICPTCSASHDAASGNGDATPDEGDVTICVECGELTLFNEDLTQRLLTAEELAELKEGDQWAGIQSVQIAIRMRSL